MSDSVDTQSVAAGQLRSIVERIERLDEDKKAIADDIKEVMLEAKSNGFDVGILRIIIKLRKKPAAERAEEEAILELYLQALDMPTGISADTLMGRSDEAARPAPRAAQARSNVDHVMVAEGAAISNGLARAGGIAPRHSPAMASEVVGGFPVAAAPPNAEVTGENVIDSESSVTGGESAAPHSNIAGEPLTNNSGRLCREECVTALLEPTTSETPSGAQTGSDVGTVALSKPPVERWKPMLPPTATVWFDGEEITIPRARFDELSKAGALHIEGIGHVKAKINPAEVAT